MNPLYRNDRPGTFPESYYVATADIPAERPSLDGDARADVAVIGAGYTGLSTALHAAEKGLSVIVIDAHRVGFGASGRNGGQVGTGWNKDQHWLDRRFGKEDARRLWDLTVEAKALTRSLATAHAPDAAYKPGVLHGEWTLNGAEASRRYAGSVRSSAGLASMWPASWIWTRATSTRCVTASALRALPRRQARSSMNGQRRCACPKVGSKPQAAPSMRTTS